MMKLFRKKTNEESITLTSIDKDDSNIFSDKSIKDLLAVDGVNPNPLGHFIINDKGIDIYVRTLTINTLPKRTTFAKTFEPLFNYQDNAVSILIDPLLEGKAIKQLDKQVTAIESEVYAAKDDRNRFRKMQSKLNKTEQWAHNIESGDNALYEVGFVFSIFANDLDELNAKTNDFISRGRSAGIEIVGCYAVQPEAYLSNGPYNRHFKLADGFMSSNAIKKHIMDKFALSTIYNHTSSSFSHPGGVPLGRNMDTAEVMLYDPYDASHLNYNAVIVGASGSGKSATSKMIFSRMTPFDTRMATIDSEKRGNRGEYSLCAENLGGENFEIRVNSANTINVFEIDEQLEFDEVTDTEYRVLRLLDKVSDITNIILTMIVGNNENPDFKTGIYVDSLLQKAITTLYNDRQIYDSNPDSLYTKGEYVEAGILKFGLIKKDLPTISDLYIQILKMQRDDNDEFHREAYTLLVDVLRNYVRELYYDRETLEVYTKEQAIEKNRQQKASGNQHFTVVKVIGNKGFYDGQSTIKIDLSTPMVNIDISNLPDTDIPVGQQIALNFLNENFIKKNSENAKVAGKLIVLIDEAHRMFNFAPARVFLSDIYRTARKRNVSAFTATQRLADYDGYEETKSILSNVSTKFIFKQVEKDRDFIKANTCLTTSQVDRVLRLGGDGTDSSKERRGEVCIEDSGRVAFVKVDYLVATEARIVETNMAVIEKMHKKDLES